MKYLTLEKNVNPARVSAVSYGATAPMGDNSTPQGREQNRRVEIRLYSESITTGDDTTAAQAPTVAQSPRGPTAPTVTTAPKPPTASTAPIAPKTPTAPTGPKTP